MSESPQAQPERFNRTVALNLVIGNMVGTGVFTSIGFQVNAGAIPDPFAILVIWFAGGVLAFCGALSYAEVATTYPKSGGEYSFLSRLYHPLVGLMSGWVSIVVGFSAAIAALAKASASYLLPFFQKFWEAVPLKLLGTGFIVLAFCIQFLGNKQSGKVQIFLTTLKLVFIAFLVISAWASGDVRGIGLAEFAPSDASWDLIGSAAFAGSLVWVMYAYSGWNASTYIVEQLENPRKDLIVSVLLGTAVVTLLYILLNASFLHVTPMEELAGRMDPGNLLVEGVFSAQRMEWFSLVFGLTLLAGMNAMFIAGPRVAQQIGRDYPVLKSLGYESSQGTPTVALGLIGGVTLTLFLVLPFETIVEYTGVTLSLFSMLTVIGVFVIRYRKDHVASSIPAWGYPITPLLFIGFSCWMIWFFVRDNPWLVMWSFLTLLPAVVLYAWVQSKKTP